MHTTGGLVGRIGLCWLLTPLLGCHPCPTNKCVALYAATITVFAADTGDFLADAGVSLSQNGTTSAVPVNTALCGGTCPGYPVAAVVGPATISASAAGYQSATRDVTFEATPCGGVVTQKVKFSLAPVQATTPAAILVTSGASTICGEE